MASIEIVSLTLVRIAVFWSMQWAKFGFRSFVTDYQTRLHAAVPFGSSHSLRVKLYCMVLPATVVCGGALGQGGNGGAPCFSDGLAFTNCKVE
jgi:hypothetical protein